MLEIPESSVIPSSFNASTIDERSDAELDALPFGVISLDEEGIILRYNLYESRLARLDRNQVLGRNFFTDIAPCTSTQEFEGRFRAFVNEADPQKRVRFDYIFDFKFGAQEVSVELLRVPAAARFYLLINRQRVTAPRPDFPAEKLAALQRNLAPNEDREGVLRDELERRFIDAPAALFSALRTTCERLAPEAWQLFSTEWGVQWGRRTAVDLEASVLEQTGRSLRELPMAEVATRVATYYGERGFGLASFDFSSTAEGILRVDVARSALAEAVPKLRSVESPQRTDLACHLLAGSFSAVLSSIAGRRLVAREVECAAAGSAMCTIVVISYERRAAVDAVLHAGERGFDNIRLALRRAPRMVESRQ
ncbi:MAG: PAS domain-containing protein [Polyangiaceae bacterium]|nr:PAS domain-containing protein [Polyangiaceae bacterium]